MSALVHAPLRSLRRKAVHTGSPVRICCRRITTVWNCSYSSRPFFSLVESDAAAVQKNNHVQPAEGCVARAVACDRYNAGERIEEIARYHRYLVDDQVLDRRPEFSERASCSLGHSTAVTRNLGQHMESTAAYERRRNSGSGDQFYDFCLARAALALYLHKQLLGVPASEYTVQMVGHDVVCAPLFLVQDGNLFERIRGVICYCSDSTQVGSISFIEIHDDITWTSCQDRCTHRTCSRTVIHAQLALAQLLVNSAVCVHGILPC